MDIEKKIPAIEFLKIINKAVLSENAKYDKVIDTIQEIENEAIKLIKEYEDGDT